jgi:hypothetical protein
MSYTEFSNEAQKLYEAKLNTGLYDNYPKEALEILWEDCARQVATMQAINERSVKMNVQRF